MIQLQKERLRRECRCGKMFIPEGKYCRVCNDCFYSAREIAFNKIRKEKNGGN